MTYFEWCKLYNCDHAHCPNECEHPQPFIDKEGILICGQCAILRNNRVEMIPCSPKNCK